jgi:hypothetical protein
MVARRPPRPFVQGALDGLCGVYSIINGLAWALHTHKSPVDGPSRRTKRLNSRDCEELFAALTSALLKRKRRDAPIVDGLHSLDVSRLLRESALWLREHHRLELHVIRPFYHRRRISMQRAVRRLSLHLSEPGSAVIIGIESPWQHWTVAIAVDGRRLHLLDSDGLARLSLRHYGRNCEAHTGLLRPSGVFLLSVVQPLSKRFN